MNVKTVLQSGDSAAEFPSAECFICREDVGRSQMAIITKCGHRFCLKCIDRWTEERKDYPTCPYCRRPYNHGDIRSTEHVVLIIEPGLQRRTRFRYQD